MEATTVKRSARKAGPPIRIPVIVSAQNFTQAFSGSAARQATLDLPDYPGPAGSKALQPTPTVATRRKGRRGIPRTFMPRLFEALTSPTDNTGIRWSEDGNAIEIDLTTVGAAMSKYFNGRSYLSWTSQIYKYGFTTSKIANIAVWRHPTLTRASTREEFVNATAYWDEHPQRTSAISLPPLPVFSPTSGQAAPLSGQSSSAEAEMLDAGGSWDHPSYLEAFAQYLGPGPARETEFEASVVRDAAMPDDSEMECDSKTSSANLAPEEMVVDSEVAGPNPSQTEHEETFLARLFRISRDKMNASVVGWTSDGHLAVYDPDRLPEVLGLGLTFGAFWQEMTRHGFVMKAMRYHHFDSTRRIFYAWKHSLLDAHCSEEGVARLGAGDSLRMTEDADADL
ncbi:HSF-DOMAIN domain-containing protein [Mycena chlorophos]|uniref:HSF-DOMAIN domain-containing protein n=1 Tax=Mycena chlorophos TaxID=658473 RepID=A0A8H6W5C1_MYCCL|nr:HSF-DOMAIN domain-containing protein [Mycena chlorophos]